MYLSYITEMFRKSTRYSRILVKGLGYSTGSAGKEILRSSYLLVIDKEKDIRLDPSFKE